MNQHPVFEIINEQFIKAVDKILLTYQQYSKDIKMSDNKIGGILSPNNKYVVKKIRDGKVNLNHYQMLTFADHFKIPYEYFYHRDLGFDFILENNQISTKADGRNKEEFENHIQQKIDKFIKELNPALYNVEMIWDTLKDIKQCISRIVEKSSNSTAIILSDQILDPWFSLIKQPESFKTSINKDNSSDHGYKTEELFQNQIKTMTELTPVKDQLIESKDSQIQLLTKYTEKLELLLETAK